MKQRLIGAAVLVVLAVVFLPMVFDGSEETQTESIDLAIPAEPGRAFETRVVPLDPAAPAAAPADPNAVVTVDANAPERPDALAGTPDAPAPTAAPAPAPATAHPAAVSPATPATSSGAAPTVPVAVAGGRYAVSFGSYANTANARALAASLKQGGIDARAEAVDVNGKPGMRVRAGPYADRAEAEKVRLLARAVRADAPGAVVEIDAGAADAAVEPARAAAAATPARAGAWAVQVGAYQDQGDATNLREKLIRAGFPAYIDTVRTDKGTMHRVRVGPEPARASADALRGAIQSKLGLEALVVRHP